MLDHTIYDLTQQLQGKLGQRAFARYQEQNEGVSAPNPPPIFQIRQGYAESPGWMMVQVIEFDPEPLTVPLFRRRAVYSAPGLTAAMLELLASERLLHREEQGYRLADAGREYVQKRRIFIQQVVACSPDMDAMMGIETTIAQIIDASLQSDQTWCLAHSRRRAPVEDRPAIEKVLQYCQDFNAFRDDAHMAAYGEVDVTGQVWEAFTFITDEKAEDASTLFDQLAYRGFSLIDWQDALDNLVSRGWLQQNDDVFSVTEQGQQIRQQVEQKTDERFFAPWQTLDETALHKLIDGMQAIVAL